MQTLKVSLRPLSPFGTRPLGDTLFGQLCRAIVHRHGEQRLQQLLQGYTGGTPFVVLSDALPAGHIPRPALPGHWFTPVGDDRKAARKRIWMPIGGIAKTPVSDWLASCKTSAELPGATPEAHPQPHNTLNRETGTTGAGQFAPYTMTQYWYQDARLDIHVVLDETRLNQGELGELLGDIGMFGFGRDASIGLGKFSVAGIVANNLPHQESANALLTLAPCAPQGLDWNESRSFYQPFTRFGRHGDLGVHLTGGPFKTPLLLAQTGAVLTPSQMTQNNRLFAGQGLGGQGTLSQAITATVHQGYAPVIAIRLPESTV